MNNGKYVWYHVIVATVVFVSTIAVSAPSVAQSFSESPLSIPLGAVSAGYEIEHIEVWDDGSAFTNDIFLATRDPVNNWSLGVLYDDANYTTFLAPVSLGSRSLVCMAVDDVLGDGNADWLIGYEESGAYYVQVLYGIADYNPFYDPTPGLTLSWREQLPVGSVLNDCTLGDVTGDGTADVVWIDTGDLNKFQIREHQTGFDFLAYNAVPAMGGYMKGVDPVFVTVTDLDKDGQNEIVLSTSSGTAGWEGFKRFPPFMSWVSPTGDSENTRSVVAVDRASTPTHQELVHLRNTTVEEPISQWRWDGVTFLPPATPHTMGPFPASHGVAIDWNQDGEEDIAIIGQAVDSIRLVDLDSTGYTSIGTPRLYVDLARLDVNSDGYPDLVALADTSQLYLFENTTVPSGSCTSDSGCAAGEFCTAGSCEALHGLGAPETVITLGAIPHGIYTADFDPDNDALDLIVTISGGADSIQVFEGVETGGTPTLSYSGGSKSVSAVAVGDVTGDGEPNIVVGVFDGGDYAVEIYKRPSSGNVLELVGDISLVAPGNRASDLALADVDGDGDLDLFVARDGGGVYGFKNDGGSFQPSRLMTMRNYDSPSIAIGDVSGDGKLDLVVGGHNTLDPVTVFLAFDPASWSFGELQEELNFPVTDIQLAHTPGGANPLDIYYSREVPGTSDTGRFQVGATALEQEAILGGGVSLSSAWKLAIGDVGGDRQLEAVYAYEPFTAPFTGQRLFYRDHFDIESAIGNYDGTIWDMIFADLTGNGFQDLVVARTNGSAHTIDVYPNRNSGFRNVGAFFGAANRTYLDVKAADVTGDGLVDAVTYCLPDGSPGACMKWFEFAGGGLTVPPPTFIEDRYSALAVGDLTANNRLDVLYLGGVFSSNDHVSRLYEGDGPGSFGGPTAVLNVLNGRVNTQIELAHFDDPDRFDDSGLLDVFVLSDDAVRVFINDGGTFSGDNYVILNAVGDTIKSFAVGEVIGDDYVNVVASYEDSAGDHFVAAFRWNSGTESWGGSGFTNLSADDVDFFEAIELVDVDGDGNLDLIGVTNGGGKHVLEGDGSGAFSLRWSSSSATAEESEESVTVDVGDVNGDGHLDFVVGSVGPGSGADYSALRLYLGDSNFDFRLAWTSRDVSEFNEVWSVTLADVNKDGDLDLYVGTEMESYLLFNSRLENQGVSALPIANRPNNPTTVKVERPLLPFSPHATTAQRVRSGDVTIPVVLTDPESDDATIRLEYSINGQGWTDAVISAPSSLTLSSSPEGTRHALTWDADGIAGSEVRVRATVARQNPTRVAEPIRFQRISDVSAPFAINNPCPPGTCAANETCVEGECFSECTAGGGQCVGGEVCYLPSEACSDPNDACANVNCAAGEECYQGSCFPGCDDNGDCTPPFLCFDGRCQIDACDDVNCPEGDTCVGGSCFEDCVMDADCMAGEACLTNGATDFCQTTIDRCVGIACAGGEECVQGGCFPSVCGSDAECVNGACFPALGGCAEQKGACDGVICAVGEVCVEGGCFQSCAVSADCDDPDHVCYDATFCAHADDPCINVECPASYACHEGACYPSCVDDDDCAPPDVCFDSACINGEDPCENVACAEGDVCHQGSCFPSCTSNMDCNPPFSVCFDSSFCQDTFDPCAGVVCAIGESCHESSCFPGCDSSVSCASGQDCYTDYCTTAGDACAGVVCPEGEVCWEGGCFQGCAAGSDCTVPTQCFQNDSDPSATTERCVPDACEGIACLEGEVCYGGGCFTRCTDDMQCNTEFEKCFDAMRCATNPCQDVECPIGQFCHGGSCYLGCGLNQDCPGYAGFEGFVDVALATNMNTPNHKTAGLTMGDINRDGALDGVINTGTSLNTRLYLSDANFPDPIFLESTSSNAPALTDRSRDRSVVLGDFTHNGYLDVARNTSGAISVHENAGASPWFPTSLTTHYTSSSPDSTYSYNTEGMGWIDFDGDGDLDLIAQNQTNSMVVLENDPVGVLTQLSSAQVSTMGLDGGSANGDFLAMGDIQPNGNVDILLRMPGTSVPDLFINDGDGTFTQSSAFNQDANNRGPAVFCDLDNDGDLDIIWATTPLGIWENTGAGTFVATSEPELSAGVTVTDRVNDIACGDFNNNGMLDIYLGMHGAEDILFQNRTTSSGWDFVQRSWGVDADGDSKSLHIADYNRSGSVDILVNHDDGNYLWRNNKVGNNYLMIQPQIDIGSGQTREAVGATVVVRDADGVVLGARTTGNARGRGGQEALAVHYGLPYGPKVPYWLTVIYPGGDMTEVCVVPELLSGYQSVEILDTDSDDVTACTLAGDWTADIELPGSGDFCFDGRCAETSCSGVQCGSEEVCYGGNCREDCSGAGVCPAGSICHDGACLDPIDPECDGGDFVCQVDSECVAGECMPLCGDDTDCGASEYCYLGVCRVDDCGSVSCGAGEVCYRGVCFEDCSSDGMCGEADESCFEGRCASDGCAALTDDYDSNFIYRELDRRLVADQVSRPFFWPRPVRGASGTSAIDWLGFTGTSVTGESAPPPRTARVYMYFDETAPDGSNSEGRYALWLATGPDGPLCSGLAAPVCDADSRCEWDTAGLSCDRIEAAPTATYRIHIKDPGDDPEILLNDDNEGVRIFQPYDSPDEYLIQTQITNESDTGGILIGYLDGSAAQDWVVRIEAAFGGGVDNWEFYSPDGYHVPIDPRQRLTIRSRSFIDYRFTPDAGIPCEDDPVNSRPDGICGLGTSYCESGVMRCEYTVQPWEFEVCDGLDNNCDGDVDEIEHLRVPDVEWRQFGTDYSRWVTIDTDTSAPSILNFTPAAGDDRVGSVDILDHEGNSIQAVDRQAVAMHRNLRTGELSMAVASGRHAVGESVNSYSDRDVEMRVRFNSSSDSIDEMMVSWWDDRNTEEPSGLEPVGWGGDDVDDVIPEWETVSRFDLEWELQRSGSGTTATVEADAALLKAMWSGQSADFSEQISRLRWTDSALPEWRLYVARQPVTPLNRFVSLRTRITPVPLDESLCAAGGDGACQYGRYQCVAGELSCGPPSAAVCNTCVDADGDGYAGYDAVTCLTGRDCDDSDPNINPGVQEVCNGIDNDCDGIADVKDDEAYQMLWGEPRPASAETCPMGTSCGPAECDFAFACVCPDGPEDPTDPPSEPCVCGSGLDDAPAMSVDLDTASNAPLSDDAPDTHPLEDPDAACSAAGGDLPPVAIVLIVGLFGIRLSRKLSV